MKLPDISHWLPGINKVVRFFIISDLIMWAGWGFIDPIFSIFVIQKITGATLVSIGVLAMIYWITKGILQIPISLFLDKTEGEKDDFYALIFGLMITGLAAFSFMIVQTMPQVYLVQFIKAIGFALYVPAWAAIFSRHLDKDHTAFDWAMSSSSVSISIGIAGFIGGSLASLLGFNLVFLITGLLALLSATLLLLVPNLILSKTSEIEPPKMVDHSQVGIK